MKVKDMLGRLLSWPRPEPQRQYLGDPDITCKREEHVRELAKRTHDIARRVHVLEWQTMPDFQKLAADKRRDGEQTDVDDQH